MGSREPCVLAGETSAEEQSHASDRRRALKRMGRFVAVTAPAVTLLLAAKSKPANAQEVSVTDDKGPPISSRRFKIRADAADATAALATLGSLQLPIDPIDGVGLCLAAIKGLVVRVNALESRASQR